MLLATPARGSCLPQGSARPALPGAKEKHMVGPRSPLGSARNKSLVVTNPAPNYALDIHLQTLKRGKEEVRAVWCS